MKERAAAAIITGINVETKQKFRKEYMGRDNECVRLLKTWREKKFRNLGN